MDRMRDMSLRRLPACERSAAKRERQKPGQRRTEENSSRQKRAASGSHSEHFMAVTMALHAGHSGATSSDTVAAIALASRASQHDSSEYSEQKGSFLRGTNGVSWFESGAHDRPVGSEDAALALSVTSRNASGEAWSSSSHELMSSAPHAGPAASSVSITASTRIREVIVCVSDCELGPH